MTPEVTYPPKAAGLNRLTLSVGKRQEGGFEARAEVGTDRGFHLTMPEVGTEEGRVPQKIIFPVLDCGYIIQKSIE